MITIYNKKDGKAKTLDPVDAREHVNNGNWTYNEEGGNEDQSIEASMADLEQLRGEIYKTREDLQISEEARLKALKNLGDIEAEFEKSESELSRSRSTIVRLEKALAEAQGKASKSKSGKDSTKAPELPEEDPEV